MGCKETRRVVLSLLLWGALSLLDQLESSIFHADQFLAFPPFQ